MRVISQDGRMDIPYKECIFQAWENDIWCLNAAMIADENGWKIATYSTEGKALKAMEMCRDRYMKYEEVYSNGKFHTYFENPKVFQFPENEEIEL